MQKIRNKSKERDGYGWFIHLGHCPSWRGACEWPITSQCILRLWARRCTWLDTDNDSVIELWTWNAAQLNGFVQIHWQISQHFHWWMPASGLIEKDGNLQNFDGMNCALKALSTGQQRTTCSTGQQRTKCSTGQQGTKCNSISCATLHNGQSRSLSVCPLYWYMYKNVWNTQSKPCNYEFQMPINIHLQIRFPIMNSAKCPINIKSIASITLEMPFLPSTNN